MGVKIGTINSWIRILNKGLTITKGRRGGAYNVKIKTPVSDYIKERIDSECWVTMKDLQGVIRIQFGLEISESALATHIDEKLNISYTLIKVMKPGNNSESTKTERKNYIESLMQVSENEYNKRFIFIDESGFQPASFKKRG